MLAYPLQNWSQPWPQRSTIVSIPLLPSTGDIHIYSTEPFLFGIQFSQKNKEKRYLIIVVWVLTFSYRRWCSCWHTRKTYTPCCSTECWLVPLANKTAIYEGNDFLIDGKKMKWMNSLIRTGVGEQIKTGIRRFAYWFLLNYTAT